jgi:hypothetical protein
MFYPETRAELRLPLPKRSWVCESYPDITQLGAGMGGNAVERTMHGREGR